MVVSLAAAIGLLPPFLLGASSTLIRADLGYDQVGTGLGVTAFFGTSALSYTLGGRLADRWGPAVSIRTAVAGTAACFLGVAVLAQSLWHIVALLVGCGLANGLAQPATSLALARGQSTGQGVAFGMRQAAAPVATVLAGAAVPLIGVTLGWRWMFGFAAILGVAVAAGLSGSDSSPSRSDPSASRVAGGMVLLAAAAAVAGAAPTSLAAFFVEGAVEAGQSAELAGWLLVAGSIIALTTRLAVGWVVDHGARHHLLLTSGLLGLGAVGFVSMAVGDRALALFVGIAFAYGIGWGWSGLLLLMVVRAHPDAAGAASGVLFTGLAVGATVGPLGFGVVVHATSFAAGWSISAGAVVLASLLLYLTGRRVLAPAIGTHGSA